MINTPDNTEASRPIYFSAHDIHAYYGESYIVQGISLNVHEGEILALLGRNGAGKTSTLRAIARLDDPTIHKGEIWLDHQPLHKMQAWEAAQAGIALVPEDRRIIQGLTVEENLQLAQIEKPIGWSLERIYELFPRLGERRKQEGTTLSGGEQQMLAIGRAGFLVFRGLTSRSKEICESKARAKVYLPSITAHCRFSMRSKGPGHAR